MKKLYIIGGTMGVGKTTVCCKLKHNLRNSVFLDGDWCWDMNPFTVNDETTSMVVDNICHVLNNFLHCSAYDNVIFCWVMHRQEIIDTILCHLDTANCKIINVSLIADEKTICERLSADVENGQRTADVIARSLERLPLYSNLDTTKIDTTDKTVEKIAKEICAL